MAQLTFTAGVILKFEATFYDTETAPTDPTHVVFQYSVGGGAAVRHEYPTVVERLGVGEYAVELDTTGLVKLRDATLVYQWSSQGAAQLTTDGTVLIQAPAFTAGF